MSPYAARILVIGSGPADGQSAFAALSGARAGAFISEAATRLADGLECLRGSGFAAVLLDGPELDSQRDATVEQIRVVARYVPILVRSR
jgi:hypothetical protein